MFDQLRLVTPHLTETPEAPPVSGDKAASEDIKPTENTLVKAERGFENVYFDNATFEWLAQEIRVLKHKFEPSLVDTTFSAAELMKTEFEAVQKVCF